MPSNGSTAPISGANVNISAAISYSASSQDGQTDKKMDSVSKTDIYPPFGGASYLTIGVDREYGRSLGLSQNEINQVSNVLTSIRTVSYGDFISSTSALNHGQKLLLLASLNELLYKYAYDENEAEKPPLSSSDRIPGIEKKGYGVIQSIINNLLSGETIPEEDFAVCGGIAKFTALVARELGFDSYVVSGNMHAIAILNTNEGFVFVDWGDILATGTKNFRAAMTMYQAYTGKTMSQTRVTDPDGNLVAMIPTNEGMFLSRLGNYYLDQMDLAKNSANYMSMEHLPGSFSYATDPFMSFALRLSGTGQPDLAGVSANYHISGSSSIGARFFGYGGEGYDFGAIKDGYLGDITYSYREVSDSSFFEFRGGYTRADFNAYNFGGGSDATEQNDLNVIHMYMAMLWERPVGIGSLRYGFTENSVVIQTDAGGDGFDLTPSLTLVPQASYSINNNSGDRYYFGLLAPIQIIRTNSQQDADEFAVQPGLGLAGGANIGVGGGTMQFDILGQTSPLSNNLGVDMGFNGFINGIDPKLSFGYQWSNLPVFVPNKASVSLETSYTVWRGGVLSTGVSLEREDWPGESATKTFITLDFKF